MKKSAQVSIHISVLRQRLTVKNGRETIRAFSISTSKFGVGTKEGSFKTPAGRFRIAQKIGDGLPTGIAFKTRQPMKPTAKMLRADDLVMSRILWLDGLEKKNANTYERYIYIHGTNHEDEIGRPASHGCIRMKNVEVAELFELVPLETKVVIAAAKPVPRRARKPEKSVARERRPA